MTELYLPNIAGAWQAGVDQGNARRDKMTLRDLLPKAAGGDKAAISQLYGLDPGTASQLENQQVTRASNAQKMHDEVAGMMHRWATRLVQAPADQQPAIYAEGRAYVSQHPEIGEWAQHLPEQFDPQTVLPAAQQIVSALGIYEPDDTPASAKEAQYYADNPKALEAYQTMQGAKRTPNYGQLTTMSVTLPDGREGTVPAVWKDGKLAPYSPDENSAPAGNPSAANGSPTTSIPGSPGGFNLNPSGDIPQIASLYGAQITSGYRTPQHNAELPGSAPNSWHTRGDPQHPMAYDLVVPADKKAAAIADLRAKHYLVIDTPANPQTGEGAHLHVQPPHGYQGGSGGGGSSDGVPFGFKPSAKSKSAADDPYAKDIADAVANGDQPPDLKGLYGHNAAVRSLLEKRGYNLTRAQQDFDATKKLYATLNGAQQVRLREAVGMVKESIPLLRGLITEWDAGGFPALNKAQLELAKQGALGQKAQSLATRLDQQIADMTGEMGTVIMGGNSPTDHGLELAGKQFSSNWTKQTALEALTQTEQNIRYRENSMNNLGTAGISDGRFNQQNPTQALGGQQPPAAPQSSAPPAGSIVWQRVNGKLVQVKQ